MRLIAVSVLVCGSLAAQPAYSQGPNTQQQLQRLNEQVTVLQQQIAALQAELDRMKAQVQVEASGNMRLVTPGSREDSVVGQHRIAVGTNNVRSVGQSSTENISVNSTQNIGGSLSQTIGGSSTQRIGANSAQNIGANSTLSVSGNSTQTIGGTLSQTIGGDWVVAQRRAVIEARESLLLKSGKSSIELKANGEINITGVLVNIEGSGDVTVKSAGSTVLKGTRILQN
jgi:type VI secretion system secreted protein VgrG